MTSHKRGCQIGGKHGWQPLPSLPCHAPYVVEGAGTAGNHPPASMIGGNPSAAWLPPWGVEAASMQGAVSVEGA